MKKKTSGSPKSLIHSVVSAKVVLVACLMKTKNERNVILHYLSFTSFWKCIHSVSGVFEVKACWVSCSRSDNTLRSVTRDQHRVLGCKLAPSAPLRLRSTDLFSPQRSNDCSGCESVNTVCMQLTRWGLMLAETRKRGQSFCIVPSAFEWSFLVHPAVLKYLLNVIMGLSDVSGDVIFVRFLFSLQLLAAVHPFLSNHRFTVFLQLSLFLSAHPQLPPESLRFLSLSSTSLHRCLFPHISFHTGSSQVQTHKPQFFYLCR